MNILNRPTSSLSQCMEWAKSKKPSNLYLELVPILYNAGLREGVDPTLVVVQCANV